MELYIVYVFAGSGPKGIVLKAFATEVQIKQKTAHNNDQTYWQ